MATSKNAKIQFESGQQVNDYAVMTDSGDHMVFTIAGGTVFSKKGGFEPIVRPNGVVSGRNMVSAHTSVDTVTIAAFTAYSKGILYSVSGTTLTIARAATDVAKICSVTMDDTGAIAEVEGADSTDTSFSEVRGSAGGPPSIPADSVEIAQIRMTTNNSQVITADEIFQTVGTHAERYDYPVWEVNTIGEGDKATVAAKRNAHVKFDSAFPMIHGATPDAAADLYKNVYLRYYSPIFVTISKAMDFVPAENTHSTTSTQVYGNKSVGSSSLSLGQGSFVALMNDNVTDALLQEQDEICTIKHFPDRNKTPYVLTQGILGIGRTFPVSDQNRAECTISAETKSASFNS